MSETKGKLTIAVCMVFARKKYVSVILPMTLPFQELHGSSSWDFTAHNFCLVIGLGGMLAIAKRALGNLRRNTRDFFIDGSRAVL